MKSHSSVHALPVLQASVLDAAKRWLLAGLAALTLGLLAGPVAEAVESPVALHARAQEVSYGSSVEPVLVGLIQTFRTRRSLVAQQSDGFCLLLGSGSVAMLDAEIRDEMEALEKHAKVLPALMAQEIKAVQRDWRTLVEASQSTHIESTTLFVLHSQLIDQQLVLLSHARAAAQ